MFPGPEPRKTARFIPHNARQGYSEGVHHPPLSLAEYDLAFLLELRFSVFA
jgi:hypothetical protein